MATPNIILRSKADLKKNTVTPPLIDTRGERKTGFRDQPSSYVGLIAEDGFESARMDQTLGEGFTWSGNNKTSVITTDPEPTVVWSNGVVNTPVPEKDWAVKNGTHALRFRYPANDNWTEQRFTLGEQGYTDLWMSMWFRVPNNYSYNWNGTNNKLMAFWMDGYSADGDGGNALMEMRPDGTSGNSVFYFKIGSGRYTVSGGDQQYTRFITVPEDRGRWMKLVVHMVCESSEDASDGIFECYRRWEDETDFTQTHYTNTAPLRKPEIGAQGIRRGYLMGWANATYLEETEFMIDDVKFSSVTSLLEG